MKDNKDYRKHVKNVQTETDNSIILNDVAGSEFEREQDHNERESQLTPVEEVARNNVDGKTWPHTNE
ncbi:hypothetical protein [Lentibacillus salinarum]|uniref:DUF4025 domain-containing protein n=1 Tax=Lentibacillus salinarum TaxID=446820 RepID=A0ABW3ZVS0_9BACI